MLIVDLLTRCRDRGAALLRQINTPHGLIGRWTRKISAGAAARSPVPELEAPIQAPAAEHTAELAPAPADGSELEPAGMAAEWKARVLNDFAAWLEELPQQPSESLAPPFNSSVNPQPEGCDLYTLLAEFVALRQEIKFQNREQHNTLRSQHEFINTLTETAARFNEGLRHLTNVEAGIRRAAEKKILLPLLDTRDALVRGLAAARAATANKKFWVRSPKGIAGVVEGYEMALRRFDRALEQAGVRPVGIAGEPFNPALMQAVGVGCDKTKADRLVLEVQRGGFVRDPGNTNGPDEGRGYELIRAARVIVNRTGEQ